MIRGSKGRFLRAVKCAVTASLLALSAAAQALPWQGQPPEKARIRPHPPVEGPLPVFEFHSGFWLNLHHFLYEQARLEDPGNTPPARTARAGQSAWTEAVAHYARNLARQDLLFNGDMVAIKNRLAELEDAPDLSQSGLRPEMVAVLERAAPVYRSQWWPEHDRRNREWIAGVAPLVRQHGGRLAERLAAVYQTPWPTERIRVDLAPYAHAVGAYTTLEPLHATISSVHANNQGPAAFEVLFHEASHGLAAAVRDAIARECRAHSKPIPRDLWHALLFYTTGEVVRRALAEPGEGSPAEYTPYAYRHGLYARGWENYQRLLERHWQPYLDGQVDFERAVRRLVAAL